MTPQEIERFRQTLREHYSTDIVNSLCELALDGLKFRFWCEGATHTPGRLASALANCVTVDQYRRAIDKLIAPGSVGARPR